MPDKEAIRLLLRELRKAKRALLRVGCQFEFCKGHVAPPIDMVTCYCCRELYDINQLLKRLKGKP
jgi:hypothetical protein